MTTSMLREIKNCASVPCYMVLVKIEIISVFFLIFTTDCCG